MRDVDWFVYQITQVVEVYRGN